MTPTNRGIDRERHRRLSNAYYISLGVIFLLLGLGLKFAPIYVGSDDSTYGKIVGELGTFIALVFAIHLVYDVLVRRYERSLIISEIKSEITDSLKYFLEDDIEFKLSGLRRYYSGLPIAELFKKFRTAKQIQILQIWTGLDNSASHSLKLAIKNGCIIRILLLNPEAKLLCNLRTTDLQLDDPEHIPNQIKSNLGLFLALSKEATKSGQVEIRVYNNITPTIPMYFVDDTVYIGSKWRGRQNYSVGTPYFKADRFLPDGNKKSRFGELADHHFDDIWENYSELYTKVKWNGNSDNTATAESSAKVFTPPDL